MNANPISLAIAVVLAGFGVLAIALGRLILPGGVLIALAVVVLASLRMAQQWEQAVVLRAGKFLAVKGPGLFGIVPIVDHIAAMIDTRVRTTQFVAEQTLTKDTVPVDVDAIIFWIVPILDNIAALIDTRLRTTQFVAEQTLTKDSVPVDVDAIIFWMVTDVRRAALEVASYGEAISWAAQTSLREMIGAADLAMLLSNRKAVDEELRKTIDAKSEEWGIRVRSVEIRDVTIPVALQDAMSREAQAERERHARVILGAAEAEIAHSFAEAARTYADNPIALHLRGMNMLYESVKERGSTIIVPSSAVDSMNLGGVAGITALSKTGETSAPSERSGPPGSSTV